MKIQIPFEILLFLKRISPVSDPKLQRRVNFLPNVITSIFPRKISSQLFNATRRRHRDLFPAHPLESLLLSATHSSHPPLPPPITDLSLSLYPMLGGIEPRSLTVPSYPPRRNPLSPLFSLSSSSLSSPHTPSPSPYFRGRLALLALGAKAGRSGAAVAIGKGDKCGGAEIGRGAR